MIKRNLSQLAVYQIEEDVETIPLTCLRGLYLEKTSEIVYITQSGVLYGIICLGDMIHHSQAGKVHVNKRFTTLTGYNVIKAHEIFRTKGNIHKIPVIDKEGKLIGDYSRWDDVLYIERNQERFMKRDAVKNVLSSYEKVYVIEPAENAKLYYGHLLRDLEQFQVAYEILSKREIGNRLSEKSIYIFLNEDEKRGMQCLYRISLDQNEMSVNTQWKVRFTTYAHLLCQIMNEVKLESLKIRKPKELPYSRLDDKTTMLFSALKEKGIRCFCMYFEEYKATEYGKKIEKEVAARVAAYPINRQEPWLKREENKKHFEAFYGELSQLKDYMEGIAQKEIYHASVRIFECEKNISGKYFNAKEGRRVTCFQPDSYRGTIYLLGPCTTIGAYSEDQYTIGSYLQKRLLEQGYAYRVENYGAMLRPDSEIDSKLQEIGRYHANDIVITLSRTGKAVGVEGGSIERIFQENKVPSEWIIDGYAHCNHGVNQLIAEDMLEMIRPYLSNEEEENDIDEKVQIDFQNVMRDYIQHKYLKQHFHHFPSDRYNTIGAIVMNCNPFSRGHLYLIDQARQQVEFLIVFAVEEDASLFPFEERIKMIMEGTKDLDNVMVVPSGEFILSNNNMQEYFTKEDVVVKSNIIAMNAEYDINVFADYIAGPLHITHRFAGEEPEDKVTQIYNEAMEKILPQKGIAFVEIPRIMEENEIVSASRVRKYMKEERYDKAFALVPETTKRYLIQQI